MTFNDSNIAFRFCLVIILIVSFNKCANNEIKTQGIYTIEDENPPVQESWNAKIIFSENGLTKAVLFSDHIQSYNNPQQKLLTKVKIDFYNSMGQPASQLTSKRGKVDDLTENMYAIDSVVAYNDSSQVRLETEELMWRKEDKKIVSDKFVRITTVDEIIEGYGFESDQALKNYTIYDVTYQTTLKKEKK